MSAERRPTRVILARHGEAEYESDLMEDAGGSLTGRGRAQAHELGERLVGRSVTAVVCSELARAVQTAEIAAAVLRLPVTVRRGLQEFSVADHAGRAFDARDFDPVLSDWLRGDLDQRLVGGETGWQVSDRVLAVLETVAESRPGETVLAVSHGGAMLAVLGRVAPGAAGTRPDIPRHAKDVPNCSSYELLRDADGWTLPPGSPDPDSP